MMFPRDDTHASRISPCMMGLCRLRGTDAGRLFDVSML
jgi:hypothetical protein